jgi:hypothetical protein
MAFNKMRKGLLWLNTKGLSPPLLGSPTQRALPPPPDSNGTESSELIGCQAVDRTMGGICAFTGGNA